LLTARHLGNSIQFYLFSISSHLLGWSPCVHLPLFVQAPSMVKPQPLLRKILVFKENKYPSVCRVRWLDYRGSLPQIQRKDSTSHRCYLCLFQKFHELTDHRLLGMLVPGQDVWGLNPEQCAQYAATVRAFEPGSSFCGRVTRV